METLADGTRVWHGLTGEVWRFAPAAGGGFTAPAAINARLVVNAGGTATITENQGGTRYEFESGSPAKLTAIRDRNNNQIALTYASGRLAKITDTQGRELVFDYYPTGDLHTITDPTGRVWDYEYDSDRRLTGYSDPEAKLTAYRYDAGGRLDQITDPRGNTTRFGYDASDRVTSVKRVVDGTTSNDITTTFAYSAASAPCAAGDAGKTVVTDPRGFATTYCVDGKDQVVKVRNAKGQDAARSYTPNGDTDLFTELAGTGNAEITDLTYATSGSDPSNNLLSGKAGPQEPFTVGYCGDAGLPACSGSDPLDRYRARSFADEQGADQFYGYDAAGNLTDVKDDATTPRNRATLTYNPDGTLATATDGEGNQTTFEYFTTPAPQAGNLKKVTPPLPLGATQYTYDALGRIDVVTDPRGKTFDYQYDGLDRVTRITLGSGEFFAYTYDANGNVTEREDSVRGSTLYAYDELNRRTDETFPDANSNQYTWDKSSNLRTLTDPGGTTSYSYDELDRVTAIVAPNAYGSGTDTIAYTYQDTPSSGPRAIVETFPGGATQRTELDAAGKPTQIKAANASGSALSPARASTTPRVSRRFIVHKSAPERVRPVRCSSRRLRRRRNDDRATDAAKQRRARPRLTRYASVVGCDTPSRRRCGRGRRGSVDPSRLLGCRGARCLRVHRVTPRS